MYHVHPSVSLAIKLREKQKVVDHYTTSLWQEKFTTPFCSRITIQHGVVEDVKKGIKIGKLLNLSSDLTFNCPNMVCLLADEGFVRPFQQIQ